MTRSVLLAGATGYIGSHVARELLASGYRLVCPVRDQAAPAAQRLLTLSGVDSSDGDALTLVEADLADEQACAEALGEHRTAAVVSCLASRSGAARDSERVEYGANHNLLSWALQHDVRQFTLLSAICVQKPRLAFQHEKLRFEKELAASGLTHAIVRPTAFFKSLSGQLERVKSGKPFLVFGKGQLTRCKPIAEADLARFLCLTLEDPLLRGVLPVGGPGPAISPAEQAVILEELLGRTVPLRSVPPALLSSVASVLDTLGVFSERLRDKAEFARIGHYYATESMLLWDTAAGTYSEEQTPEFGSITLRDSYAAQLAGDESQMLGDHAMFS